MYGVHRAQVLSFPIPSSICFHDAAIINIVPVGDDIFILVNKECSLKCY